MAILTGMDVNIRGIPAELWFRVRKAATAESTAANRVTMREIVLQAIEEWLAKRGY